MPVGRLHAAYALQATLQQSSYLAGTLLAECSCPSRRPPSPMPPATAPTFLAVLGVRPDGDAPEPAGRRVATCHREPRSAGSAALTAGLTTVDDRRPRRRAHGVQAIREAPAAGVLLAAPTAGSIAGGLAYGSRNWPGTLVRRYVVLLAAFAALAATTAAPRSLAPMLVATTLAGLPDGRAMTCRFALIDPAAGSRCRERGGASASAAEAAGVAAGQALAGAVVDASAPAFLLVAIPSALAGLVVLVACRHLDLEP